MMKITVRHAPGCRVEGRIERDDLCNCGAAPRVVSRKLPKETGWGVEEEWEVNVVEIEK